MNAARKGETLALEAGYDRNRLVEDFREANLGYCAAVLAENSTEEYMSMGEFYAERGDALRSAIGITVEHPANRPRQVNRVAQYISALTRIARPRVSTMA